MRLISDDTELLQSLADRDPLAFDQVFRQFYRQLCFFADSITGNSAEAEDIAVNCFVKLMQARIQFESIAKLRSWLFTTARNASLDILRMEKRHMAAHKDHLFTADSNPESIDLALIRSEAIQEIYKEIEKLPGQCRQVIRLSFIEGRGPGEIAEIMGLAYQTVQNQKQRGLQLLRTSLLRDKLLSPLLVLMALQLLASNQESTIFQKSLV